MSKKRIQILDEITINQIAAGEVIENSASVIKELVENAIDSGAQEILVETHAGGRSLIKITDDGCGMDEDELLLAVERHATSKLSLLDDLNQLTTMGFRGEALPSIASVSKMKLHSATTTGKGHLLPIVGGRLGLLTPMPRRQGTTIEVESLFFNVPVRKKFQKSIASDNADIHKLMLKFAVGYPKLGVRWIQDGEVQLSFAPDHPLDLRIKALLGDEFLNQSFSVEHENEKLHLSGKISGPFLHRPSRAGQYLFVNQRAVTSSFLSKEVLESYGTRLSQNRYPLFVLHLNLPPSWIDVNVHPQKKEIRFREEETIKRFIQAAIEKGLERPKMARSLPSVTLPSLPLTFFATESKESSLPKQEAPSLITPQVKIIAQVKEYFFIEEADGIRVIHIRRAKERLLFNTVTIKQKTPTTIQQLLIPLQLHFTSSEKKLVLNKMQALQEAGFSLRPFGGTTFICDCLPACLNSDEAQDVILAFLEGSGFARKLSCLPIKGPTSREMAAAMIGELFKHQEHERTPEGKKIHYLLDSSSLDTFFQQNSFQIH